MRIGELSRQSGVPGTALRYWEQVGLLPRVPRVSGRREYGEDALRRVGLLLLAQECGFTLAETRRLFAPGLDGKAPSARWEMLAEVKLAEIDRVERLLEQMRSALESVRSCHCVDLDACGALAVQLLASPPGPGDVRPAAGADGGERISGRSSRPGTPSRLSSRSRPSPGPSRP
jgi:MerR family transcriptional regulator, redox-sensitive transcriptional activator SoxR